MTPTLVVATEYGSSSAPPLLYIRALPAESRQPRGFGRALERWVLRGPTRERSVYAVGRPMSLPLDADMSRLAEVYANVVRRRFDGPVSLMGMSTGASVALQLAADHPELVDSLVVAAGAGCLSPRGRAVQRRYAAMLAAGATGLRRSWRARRCRLGAWTRWCERRRGFFPRPMTSRAS